MSAPSNPLFMLDFVVFAKMFSISFCTLRILTLAVVVSLTVCWTDSYKLTIRSTYIECVYVQTAVIS